MSDLPTEGISIGDPDAPHYPSLECLNRRRRVYVNIFDFIALSGKHSRFDADRQTENRDTWFGREERGDEVLYLIDGNRWILVFAPGPGHPNEFRDDPDRELSQADAARWLMRNEHELPASLRLDQIDFGTDGQDGPNRLDRNWRPPAPPAVTTPDAADLRARDSAPPPAATGGATGGEQGPEAPAPAPAASGTQAPNPPGQPRAAGKAPADAGMTPGALAIAAAYQLVRDGKRVSVKAAAELAKVDRSHLIKKYPEAVATIKQLAAPDRCLPRGQKDQRTGIVEAYQEDD